jgi:carbonic anhydrase/acetyltransferase-like protein (isoleucine patch superfamily)
MKKSPGPENPDKKKIDTNEPVRPDMLSAKPGPGSLENRQSSIFSKPGPVSLQASKSKTLTLGGIKQSPSQASPDQVSPYQAMQMEATPPQPAAEPRDVSQSPAFLTSPVVTGPTAHVDNRVTAQSHNIDRTAVIDPTAIVTGNVVVGPRVFIAAGAIIHGGNAEPIYIGEQSYIQEGVVIRDLPSIVDGRVDTKRLVEVEGREFSVYIGERVAVCAQAQIHGPAKLEDRVYVGIQSVVFWASVGEGTVVEPGSLVMNVSVPGKVFVPAGLKILSQKTVNELPPLTPQYRFHDIGREMVESGQDRRKAYGSPS